MTELLTLTLEETVDELRRLVQHLDMMARQSSEDEIEQDDLREAIEQLVALNSVKATFKVAYETYEATIADAMSDEYMVKLPGNIEVTRMEGAPRKQWDHKALGKKVAEQLVNQSIDFETGEILKTTEEVVVGLLQYAAPSYWRIKELKKIGIDAGKYSKFGDPKISVSISRKGQKG
jgi:hypothetical protein